MELYEYLLVFFKKPKEETENLVPEGLCPECWGYQEYDHKIRKIFEDKQIDVGNHERKLTFMRKFVRDHIDGIRLKKGKVESCPTCGREYDNNESQTYGEILP